MIASSSQPPQYAATTPMMMPNAIPSAVASTAMIRIARPP
jgi:hypothetical protein